MGNCSVKGTTVDCSFRGTAVNCHAQRARRDGGRIVRIMTDSCRVMEYECPVRVGDIIDKFPGHRIFRRGDVLCPLLRHELLANGQLYYLLPSAPKQLDAMRGGSSAAAFDLLRNSEVLPSSTKGVWRVKMSISAEQLTDILSEQVNTEALIERMRMFVSSTETAPAITSTHRVQVRHFLNK